MPQASNIVLKDSTGVDCTFTLFTPASANAPAVWYYQNGANRSVWPKIECSSARSGSGDARKVKWTLTVPDAVVDGQGVTRPGAKMFFNTDGTTPTLVSDTTIANATAFQNSLASSDLFRESVATGYAPS